MESLIDTRNITCDFPANHNVFLVKNISYTYSSLFLHTALQEHGSILFPTEYFNSWLRFPQKKTGRCDTVYDDNDYCNFCGYRW